MNVLQSRRLTLVLALVAAIAVALASSGSPASAITPDDFQAALADEGFTATIDPTPVEHATLHVAGVEITVEKGGKSATLELIVYETMARAKEDWNLVSGNPALPNVPTADFAGRVLYWNTDSVLAVDFRSPNEAGVALEAASVFLGTSAVPGAPATGTGVATGTSPSPMTFAALVAVFGSGLFAAAHAVARARR